MTTQVELNHTASTIATVYEQEALSLTKKRAKLTSSSDRLQMDFLIQFLVLRAEQERQYVRDHS